MKTGLIAAATAGVFLVRLVPAAAGTIPYPNIGTINPASYTFTAESTGTLTAYFYGSTAADTESLTIKDVTTNASVNGFDNQSAAIGATLTLSVNAGDSLVFSIYDSTSGVTISSTPSQNGDHDQHVYSTAYAGGYDNVKTDSGSAGAYLPAGTYVGFEDTLAHANSDFNYADEQFVFTNLSNGGDSTGVPEPASMTILAGAIAGLGALRRRFRAAG